MCECSLELSHMHTRAEREGEREREREREHSGYFKPHTCSMCKGPTPVYIQGRYNYSGYNNYTCSNVN